MSRRNQSLNLLKAIACIAVVFIHVRFPGTFGTIMQVAAQFAVPVFFLIAGYFSYDCDSAKIEKRLARILKILLFSYLCFFVYDIVILLVRNQDIAAWFRSNFTWKTPIFYIVFCTVDFATPLWYLIAMAETYCAWYFIAKKHKKDLFVKLMPLFLVISILFTTVSESLNWPWPFRMNFIVRAVPWFLFGCMVRKDSSLIEKFSNIQLAITAFVAFVASLLPVIINTRINFSYACCVVSTTAIFLLAIKNPSVETGKFVQYLGDKLSLYVYISHYIIRGILFVLVEKFGLFSTDNVIYTWIQPLLVVAISILVALVIDLVFGRLNRTKATY